MYYIHSTECIECGMCKSICPVDAIRYADEVNADEAPFVTLNDAAFRDREGGLIDPGGWSNSDPPIADPPELTNLADATNPSAEDVA